MARNSSYGGITWKLTGISERGWAEYRAGMPYPAEYDSWRMLDQFNYENGRLRAANVKLARGWLPARQTRCAIEEAVRRVGKALPPRRRG
jgi:hypothetical protein